MHWSKCFVCRAAVGPAGCSFPFLSTHSYSKPGVRSEQGMHDCWACTALTPTSSSIITKQLCYHIKGGRIDSHGVKTL
ncbi:hypothetical protein ABIC01_007222 [Bradyrhizobium sp. RT4b]